MKPALRKSAMDEPRPGAERGSAGCLRRVVLLALLAVLLLALPSGGQTSSTPNGGQSSTHSFKPFGDVDQTVPGGVDDPIYAERRLRQLNIAQHKSLVADTDKLVKLVNELNAEIDRTNPNSLTSEQLRKVAEIEKLAHSVRDKMRISVQGLPEIPGGVTLPPASQR